MGSKARLATDGVDDGPTPDRSDRSAADRRTDRYVTSVLIAASVLYCLPLFGRLDQYGRGDWDQFMTRYETPRVALLRDRQFPLWNPYVNGGTVLLAHPHCPVASPWYGLVLVLGAPIGLRIQVALFMVFGAVGMATLLKRAGTPAPGRVLGGIIFMMSSHFVLHITEGHLEWCTLGLLPWLILLLARFDSSVRIAIGAALLLSSILLLGSVYIMAVYVPFLTLWILLESIRRWNLRPLVTWVGVLGLTATLSAVKLLPQLEFTGAHPRDVPSEGISLEGLPWMFCYPRQAFLYQATRDVIVPPAYAFAKTVPDSVAVPLTLKLIDLKFHEAWHEYGCYVTWAGLVLAGVGGIVSFRRWWPLYVSGLAAAMTALGSGAPIEVWPLLQQLPLYSSLHMPSRFLAAVVLVLAFAAGQGMGWLFHLRRPRLPTTPGVLWAIVLAVYLELLVMGWSLLSGIFICDPAMGRGNPLRVVPHETFAMRLNESRFLHPVMASCLYPRLMGNTGVLHGYENLVVPPGDVKLVTDPGYAGEAFVRSGQGSLKLLDWTMSRIVCEVDMASAGELVLNQNYYPGWKATLRSQDSTHTITAEAGLDGLVTVPLHPGDWVVEVFYSPDSFRYGAWISLTGLMGSLIIALPIRRRRRKSQEDGQRIDPA